MAALLFVVAFPVVYFLRYLVPSSALLIIGMISVFYPFKSIFSGTVCSRYRSLWNPLDNAGNSLFYNPWSRPCIL